MIILIREFCTLQSELFSDSDTALESHSYERTFNYSFVDIISQSSPPDTGSCDSSDPDAVPARFPNRRPLRRNP